MVALSVLCSGCGDDAPPDPDQPLEKLAHYLPADGPSYVVFADLTAAREELGLSPEAPALPLEIYSEDDYNPTSPEARLLEVARVAMPILGVLDANQITEAFDDTAVSAAVTGGAGSIGLTAIQTSQPFGDVADSLAAQGYERDGTVLSKPGAEITQVVDAGNGVIVLSGKKPDAAEAVAEPAGGPAAALALLEPEDGPVGLVTAGVSSECVTGYGGWQDAAGSSGVLRIAVQGTAELDRVELDGFKRYTQSDLGEPSVTGSEVEIPFSGADGIPLRDFQTSLGLDLYDCD
jgi:hypothetical protein